MKEALDQKEKELQKFVSIDSSVSPEKLIETIRTDKATANERISFLE